MTRVLILQSAAAARAPWIDRCLESVRGWASAADYDYLFVDDELFEPIPDWYLSKVGSRTAIAADLGRLLWIERLLAEERANLVAWLDADVLLFAPQMLRLEARSSPVFGYEHWVQRDGRKLRVRRNVHNAYCAFAAGCRVLPFLIEATQRIIERADPRFIAPQMVGPKLLTSLHNLVGFELEQRIGAISPEVAEALIAGGGPALDRMRGALPDALAGANLCATLAGDRDMDALVDALLRFRSGLR